MKKTTKYARKIAQGRAGFKDLGATIDTICACRQYTSEIVPGSWIVDSGTQASALRAMLHVRQCFESLKTGASDQSDSRDYDYIVAALGVSIIRAHEIHGGDDALLPALLNANEAMQRCRERFDTCGTWGFYGPIDTGIVAEALDVYESIVQASSPMQMQSAMAQRIKILAEQKKVAA